MSPNVPEPGIIEFDRSGGETVIRIVQPGESFTVDQLRMYAEYLATVAREAEKPEPEPEVDELVGLFNGTAARYVRYDEAVFLMARAVVAAGYKREATATRKDEKA